MDFLPIFTGIFAVWVSFRHSAARAFLDVYIPSLLLLPMYYRWVLPALPDPTFQQAAILPITVVFFLRNFKGWRYSLTDLLMVALAGCIGYSEYRNAGFKEAQNLMFDMLCDIVLPYVLTKGLIEPLGLRLAMARRIVILLFAVSLISLYEFRMGVSPWYLLLHRFFPGQGEGWVTTFRYGFARVAGPYAHAILAGLVLVIGFRLQRWLQWTGGWEPRFERLPWLQMSKARVITLGMLAGVLMTMVRGPWLGGVLGAVLTAVGRARNRKRALLGLAAAIVVIGVPAGAVFRSYVSVGRANAKSETQETAAYRAELLDKYVGIAEEKLIWGWGRNTWPKVPGMPSIDNNYLLLWLMHGALALGLLIMVFLTTIFRLVRFEMRQPVAVPRGASFGFTMAGIYVAMAVTLATVYMGLQSVPLFAILTGWSDGYLLTARKPAAVEAALPVVRQPFAFRRVVT